MPFTGDICKTTGIYTVVNHIKHPKEIGMTAGHKFPPCAECSTKVQYELKQAAKH